MNSDKREIHHIPASIVKQTPQLRVAGYARVSSDSDDQLNSFGSQLRHYTTMIEGNPDWELVEIYADEGISGTTIEKREDFTRMIVDCKRGNIDHIVTKSTSRFARNMMDTLRIIRELKSIGVSVFFEKENIDTGKMTSEHILTLHATFAENESLGISQNVKKGNRSRMVRGEYVSSSVPYGYRLINKQLEICEAEAVIVRRIFAEYLGGDGLITIARNLANDRVSCKRTQAKWDDVAVMQVLKNERYIGDMLLQKHFNEDPLPYRQQRNSGQLPQYYVKNTHSPIVDRLSFELAGLLLKSRSNPARAERQEYPLSRIVKCGECGTTYRRKVDAKNGTVYWVCRAHDKDRTLCNSPRLRESEVYDAFFRLVYKLKHSPTILSGMRARLEKLLDRIHRDNGEMREINTQIATLSEQNHLLCGLVAKGVLDAAAFLPQSDEIAQQIRHLKQAKSRLLADSTTKTMLRQTEELIALLQTAPEISTEIDEGLFGDLIQSIIPSGGDALDFLLPNGLKLRERI